MPIHESKFLHRDQWLNQVACERKSMGDCQKLESEGFGGKIVEWVEGHWVWLKGRLEQS